MTLSGSRQQFLSADVVDGETLRYKRRGGCFVSRGQCAILFIGAILLAVIAAALVYFFAPCRTKRNVNIDDLWNADDGTGAISTNLRLPKNVLPSSYRIKLTPYFNNYTFEGSVAITISTRDKNVNKIVLNSKNLVILDGSKIMEQFSGDMTDANAIKRSKRQTTENTTTVVTEAATTVELVEADTTTALMRENAADPIITAVTETETKSPKMGRVNNTQNGMMSTEKETEATIVETVKHTIPLENGISVEHDKTPTHVAKSLSKPLSITSKNIDDASETLTFQLDAPLKPNIGYVLEIRFMGILDESLLGFYRSSYKDGNITKELAITQFEPTAARKAFPCFDEPQMKAKFEISIARNKNMVALSNTPSVSDESIEGTDMILTHFGRTVPMSTYLVAFAVSDLRSADAPYDPSVINATVKPKIKIWTRESFLDRTEYAAKIAPEILAYYEEFFDIPYALEKLDLVAVPDFASGAMENWGLMTFRETALLLDPKETSMQLQQTVAYDIAHEIAHQWFGNLVTMKWWTDLWLNEGFATYMEHVGVDKVEPSWKIFDQFNAEKMSLMRTDALDSTHPVSQEVEDPLEINQKFDEISYTKGSILIRLLNHTLTENVFKKGIQNYLKKWKFSNADKDDLWASLTEAAAKHDILPANISVKKLMDSWTVQPGFPVVQVTRHYENDSMTLAQHIFTLPVSKLKMSESLWCIPISYTSGAVPTNDWSTNASIWMTEKRKDVKLPIDANNTWLYVNVFAIGYYRVNYDLENWRRLSDALHSSGVDQLPQVFKMQVLDDAFNLARIGMLNYSTVLNMSTYLVNTTEGYLMWQATLMNLDYLNVNLETSPAYGYFQDYVLSLINRTLLDIGDEASGDDTQQKILLRGELLGWACRMEHPKYLQWARNHFQNWKNERDPNAVNPIPKDSRSIVYATVLRNGGRNEFEFLWKRLNESNNPVVRAEIVRALPNTRNIDLLNRLFDYGLTDLEIQLAMDLWNGENSKIASSAIVKYVEQNWKRFYSKYNASDSMLFSSIISGVFSIATEQEELDQMKRFIQMHKHELKNVSEELKKEVTATENRIDWKKNNQREVETWLINYSNARRGPVTEAALTTQRTVIVTSAQS